MPPSQRPPFPSAPSEPSLRRLGVGGSRSGGDRPLRAQLVVALVVGFILLAVPLFLWRRPGGMVATSHEPSPGASTEAGTSIVRDSGADGSAAAPTKVERVRLGPVQRVRCSVSSRVRGQEGSLCDALPYFEKALAEGITKNVDCAPHTGKEGSISYALQIDFKRKWINVFPGASGTWKGPLARRAVNCVERSMQKPEWEAITHQYNYYMIAIVATYPVPTKIPGPSNAPTFE